MKILCIGDIVGPRSIEYLAGRLGEWRRAHGVDLIIANGENASVGNGLSRTDAQAIIDAGADVITTGNHVWQKHDLHDFLDERDCIVRPANYPDSCPGRGAVLFDAAGRRVLCMNVAGVSFAEPLASPFDAVERMLAEYEGRYDASVLDIHAEATGEKQAIARYFDGRISVIFGTHTHVQTSDARLLPYGSAYITDLGMTGPDDSILGIRHDIIIEKLRTHMPVRFEVADGDIRCDAALFTLDGSYRALSAEALHI